MTILTLLFIFNIILDNDNAIFWGIISAVPCFGWFLLGKKQLKAIKEIDYKSNSYDYLVSIQEKINHIRRFNKRLIITFVPLGFLPMLVYTYFNNQGYFNIHTPIITSSDAEGAGEMFQVTALDLNNPQWSILQDLSF